MRLQVVAVLLSFLYSNENLLQRRTGANKSEFSVCDGRPDTVKAAIASHVIVSLFLLHNCTAALMASADHRGSGSRGVGALMTLQIKEDERCGCASAPPRSRRRACWECRLKNAPFQKRLRGGKSLQQHRYEKLVTGTPGVILGRGGGIGCQTGWHISRLHMRRPKPTDQHRLTAGWCPLTSAAVCLTSEEAEKVEMTANAPRALTAS